ncbi:hypothetical protein RND81_12G206900 [Saponaria officinalis]|uniref:Thioredoxin domain-containing protein n=1 Tax=Saponaria officinalis TaxID=3572 RepID=A0AAW1HDE3_SAPOF
MAATLLNSLTILRPAAVPSSASSSLSSPTSVVNFSRFSDLKLTSAVVTRSVDCVRGRRSSSSAFRVSAAADSSDTTLQLPTISDAEWKSLVLESELPVMVDFWAPWCGPCRMVEPLINELAQQYAGKLKVYKVNTDECPTIASDYGIRSIPTVIIFKNGEKKEAVIGAVPKSTLTTCIEKFI